MLKNVTGKEEFKHMKKITIENKEGEEYIEQYDFNSKYERRPKEDPALKYLSFAQFAKMYKPYWGKNSEEENDMEDNLEEVQEEGVPEEGVPEEEVPDEVPEEEVPDEEVPEEEVPEADPAVVSKSVTEEQLRTVNGVEATSENISLAKDLVQMTLKTYFSVFESLPDDFKKLSLREIHELSRQ